MIIIIVIIIIMLIIIIIIIIIIRQHYLQNINSDLVAEYPKFSFRISPTVAGGDDRSFIFHRQNKIM